MSAAAFQRMLPLVRQCLIRKKMTIDGIRPPIPNQPGVDQVLEIILASIDYSLLVIQGSDTSNSIIL